MKHIFVACPAYSISGGPELLHQLVYKLNSFQKDSATIYYFNFINDSIKKHPTPDIFLCYTNGIFADKNTNLNGQIMVLPESFPELIQKFNTCKFILWWLSVDYFFINLKLINSKIKTTYKELKKGKKQQLYKFLHFFGIQPDYHLKPFSKKVLLNKNIIMHLYQSEYANLFLDANKLHPKYELSDYLRKDFFNATNINTCRKDQILYNPKKGYDITKQIINLLPQFDWQPLENLTPEEMKNKMYNAKIYIDFGNHPGKDRIPREAAISGCVIITNQEGSANNNIDVNIPSKFKFSDPLNQIEDFRELVLDVFKNFDTNFKEFNQYINEISFEEKKFDDQVSSLIKMLT